ncbi:IS630 family transposase [Lichenibacterium dinghuense]|uniref:IS630 family transposase n=1 Tax=Lichenibacterium dinghuense TaxID=2895977 RepID=UPI001F0285CA|nr:IS630 family transposase [Lichenibacterium sp. 6Y81]
MIKRHFLSKDDRARLTGIARDGLEEHRVARRANAILLLDKGWSCEQVSEALLLDDDTIRSWFKVYREGGVPALARFDLAGGHRALTVEQLTALKAWATEALPASTRAIGHHIRTTYGMSYTRSGLIKLMAALDFVWRKPDLVPSHLDLAAQEAFIEQHERLRNGLGADEAIVYGDAVHPTHQTRPAGVWMPRGADVAVPAASGRDRMNIHGVIDLETGATRMKEVLSVDAQSTIELLTSIENAYTTMRRIHVYLDNARYHHARAVQDWMRQPGRRIVLHFIPSYCPHLNPIERLWGVMHQNITHNRYYATFKDFAEAILTFLKETVPKHFSRFSSRITDNFRIRDPKDSRVVAS